ncbi:hypothetical protein LLG10_03420 [bacterium]|nr:hypothetical protein [bacterium]
MGFKKLMTVLILVMFYAFSMVFYYYQKKELTTTMNTQTELLDEIKKYQKQVAEESNLQKIYARALLLKFKNSTQDDIIIIDDES